MTEVWERLRVFKWQVGSPAKARHKPARCASSNWRECLCLNQTFYLALFLFLYFIIVSYTYILYFILLPYTYILYLYLYLHLNSTTHLNFS